MSCNDNQNHLVRAGRTTSRVLAPSGGGQSSLTFGILPQKPVVKDDTVPDSTAPALVIGSTEAAQSANANASANPPVENTVENVLKEKVAPANTPTITSSVPAEQLRVPVFTSAVLPSQEDAPISSNAFVTGSNMNGGCVMTGRPSSRVLAPPGGHTSFKLG